ncbi:crustacean CHH/MIH/GIH neurohormone family protein [Dictyocaulus viviparus]|uniref:Crustacean CHH/MIH/GIH neurohormone family protein n=1 Tax=Dictyocaulus viviparus TaxID=29172 RepID=A0A0D8XFZ0_DICVI|nr:crustacean CHH/MIH/GIH neurohormone family protein [Dictyocaulus viviparus]
MTSSIENYEYFQDDDCPLLYSEPYLYEIAERICEFCHEITNHEKPNMRSECRSACFSTDTFRACLNIFDTPISRRRIRSRHRI